jgi:hypothetical protein
VILCTRSLIVETIIGGEPLRSPGVAPCRWLRLVLNRLAE